MSIGNLGSFSLTLAANQAGTHMAERQGQADRKSQDATVAERRVQSTDKAEKAAGLGSTEQESAASDERDADGRRAWERVRKLGDHAPEKSSEKSLDPTGKVGKSLDLSG